MPQRTVDFDDAFPSLNGIPRGDLILFGPGGPFGSQVTFAQALIDTGAMHTMLPEDAAQNIGIDLAMSQMVTISTANGALDVRYDLSDLEFQGIACNHVGVYFGPAGSPDLIGRSTIYAACEALGLTYAGWLRKPY